jgi:Adaptin N terminal region
LPFQNVIGARRFTELGLFMHNLFLRSLDQNHQPALISIITTLLQDRSSLSIGTVAVAFEAVCPTRLDLLHQHYRRLCRLLIDVDEWGQIAWLNLLNRYARIMLLKPLLTIKEGRDPEEDVDVDLQLLLTCSEALFQSRNPAVRILTSVHSHTSSHHVGCSGSIANILLSRASFTNWQNSATAITSTWNFSGSRTSRLGVSPCYLSSSTCSCPSTVTSATNLLYILESNSTLLYPFPHSRLRHQANQIVETASVDVCRLHGKLSDPIARVHSKQLINSFSEAANLSTSNMRRIRKMTSLNPPSEV